MAKKNTRNSYPFHILLGRKPKQGNRRTYEVVTWADEACSSTQAGESLINKLIKEKRVELNEGDHLVVAQITRVRALKALKKISQVDEDPNERFGDLGADVEETDEEVEIEDGEVSDEDEGQEEEAGEATSDVELPDEEENETPAEPAAAPPPTPTPVEKKAPPAAATPPPGPQDEEGDDTLEEDDPLADLGESEGDIIEDETSDDGEETESTEDEGDSEEEKQESDGVLDEIF